MPHFDTSIVKAACGLIDITAALVVFGYCAVAFFTVVRYGDRRKAHSLVAQGALLGLSIKVIAALLKTVELQSWNQIGILFVIFLLKNLLKRIFVAEDKLSKAEELQSL